MYAVLSRVQQGRPEPLVQRGHGGPREKVVLKEAQAVQGCREKRETVGYLATVDLQDRLAHLYVGLRVM